MMSALQNLLPCKIDFLHLEKQTFEMAKIYISSTSLSGSYPKVFFHRKVQTSAVA